MEKIRYFIRTKSLGFYINLLSFWDAEKATLLAYKHFSQPKEGRLLKENLPQVLQDAITETLHLDEDHFQTYTWEGNETVTLLIHGWESNASRWEKFLPYLKESGHTIVAVDAPAHGLSSGDEFDIPQYARYIDIIIQKYQPKYIIGHSMGGIASVYYQYYYTDHNLQKMVLLGAPSDFRILIDNYGKLLSLKPSMRRLLVAIMRRKFAIEIKDFSGTYFLKDTTLNGLIVHDTNDSVVAFSESKKLSSTWKHATFLETSGLGHSMHDDELYRKIIAFLEKTE